MTLLTHAFFDSLKTSILDTDSAESLPPACYTSEEFFAFEKEAIFAREWLCVGRTDWVKNPGDYFVAEHIEEPIIIVKTRDGKLQAMSAVCQHRGMHVASGRGNTRSFTCPYHHWTYSLTGELVVAPAMEKACDFDKGNHPLPKLGVCEWQGFIFVNFDANAEPIDLRLGSVNAIVERYGMAELTGPRPEGAKPYAWNWKVMFENNNDGYHANRLHQGALHDIIPSHLSSFPELPENSAGYYRFNGATHIDPGLNATLKAVFPIFPQLTEADRHRVVFVNLPPSLSLVIMPDMIIYQILHAGTANKHDLTMGILVTPQAQHNPLFELQLKMSEDAVSEIVAQDLDVDIKVQNGLKSRFAPRGRYSWQEGAQRQFNQWLVHRYWQEARFGVTTAGAVMLPGE
jgi:nitrite reductase/ring-hydroxylating ferredoxin subunit